MGNDRRNAVSFVIRIVKCIDLDRISKVIAGVEKQTSRLAVWVTPWLNQLIWPAAVIRCGFSEPMNSGSRA